MKRNTIFYIGLVVSICILVTTLACNVTFGFFHLILVFAILMFWQMSRPPRLNANGNQNQPMNPKFAYSGAACLMIMLACSFWALNNYVNPSTNVFMNSDHHAISIDSIKIKSPKNYQLAGNSKLAFFDNLDVDSKAYAIIENIDDDSVVIILKGITTPLYRYVYDDESKRNIRQVLLSQSHLPIIHRDKEFTLINKKNERLTIKIEEYHTSRWKRLFSELSFYASDSTNYHYSVTGTNGEETVSDVTKFIRTGISLENILPEIPGFNLEGVSLLRPIVYPTADRNEIYEKLSGEYVINFSTPTINRGEIVSLEYEGRIYNIEELKTQTEKISIAYNQSIVFGYGEKRTKPITFQKGKDGLNMLLIDPCYRTLSSVSDGNGEDNTVYVTSSLATEKECVDPLLPDNVLLFDFFHHNGNVHNIIPSYLSFVNGNSNEIMNFNVHVKGSNNIAHIKAGEKYPFTPTKVSGEEWCLSIKDFKSTTPFTVKKICIFLFLVTLVAAFILVCGESRKMYYQHSGVLTYSNIEFGAYMLLIVFLTIRLFLLWRLSVFPPNSSISSFELNTIFLQGGLWKWFYTLVFVFFAFILYFKVCVIFYKEPGWFNKINILNLIDIINEKIISTGQVNQNIKKTSYINPFDIIERQRSEKIKEPNVAQDNAQSYKFNLLKFDISKYVPDLKYLTIFFACSVAIGIVSFALRSTRLCILLPVISYFIGDIILTSRYVRSYMDDMKEPDNDYIKQSHLFPFIVTSINLLYWTAILYINDSGYGILFLSFGLIWIVLRLREIDMFAEGRAKWTILLLMACFVLLIVFYKNLILLAVSYRVLFVAICACIGFALTYLIEHVILEKKHIQSQIFSSIGSAIVVSAMALVLSFVIIPGSHTEQRVRVHMSEPAEQLVNLPNQESENRFIQASLNDYILKCYYDEGDNITLFGSGGDGYFHMLPHSKIGALWGAQASDISLSRFVIAEHGQWFPIALIACFLFLLCLGLRRPAHSRVVKGLYIQVPLLLFVQSLVIWMAVTRHFIFLGQDFPLLSCNSKLTIIYTLLLLALWIAAAVYDSINTTQRSIEEDEQIQRACKRNMFIFTCFMAVIAIGLLTKGVYDQYSKDNNKYTMSSALNNVAVTFNNVKIEVPDSVLHQSKMFVNNKTSIQSSTDNVSGDDETSIEDTPIGFTLNELIDEWQNKKLGGQRWIQNIHDTRDVMSSFNNVFEKYIDQAYSHIDSTKLAKRLYEHYIRNLAMHNDYDNILHMHRNKSTGKAVLTVNSSYYDMWLPNRKRHSWIGNIIEHSQHEATLKSLNKDYYSAQRFPGDWFTDGQDVVIARIKNEKGALSIASLESEAPIVMNYNKNNEMSRVVRIFPMDNVTSNGSHATQLTSLMTTNSYFARNIQVNGQRRFVYPMGDTLYWARNFALEAQAEGKKRLRDNKLTPLGNVPLTLSMNMTRKIYNVINDSQHERAVVVADGDGHIRALVDSKSPKYKVDPNDIHRYESLCDSIYMVGGRGSKFERFAFGTLALQHLLGGPGSTQKPLVYSAVTSGFNLDDGHIIRGWNELDLDTIRDYMRNGNYFEFPQFAGIKTYKNFKSLRADEGASVRDISPDFYIYKSSNYYNSLIVYIGSHNMDSFSSENIESFLKIPNKQEGNTLFYKTKSSRLMTKDEYVSSWPIVHHIKSKSFLGFNLKPDYDQKKSLLHNRMYTLFRLPSSAVDTSYHVSIYPSLSRYGHIGYVYPEVPYLDASTRSKERTREFAEISIRQTATGQRSVWNVSPLDMAQMYCRLMPGQADINLSLDPMQPKAPWRDLEQEGNRNFDKTLKTLYRSMNQVYGPNGTAKALSYITSSLNGNEKQRYWIYGKTGTINRTEGYDDCLLVTIITNQDITKRIDEKTFRYYVVYSVLYNQKNGTSYRPIQGDIIKKVIEDPIFKEYMATGKKMDNNSSQTPVTRIGDI